LPFLAGHAADSLLTGFYLAPSRLMARVDRMLLLGVLAPNCSEMVCPALRKACQTIRSLFVWDLSDALHLYLVVFQQLGRFPCL